MPGKLIVFSAPSGSGKTTIVRALLKKETLKLKFSVSATSRKKRKNEIQDKDYYFLSQEEFKKKIAGNDFVEWEEVYKNQFYGTLKSEIERITSSGYNVVFDIDVAGGVRIKEKYNDQCLTVFIMSPSIEELERRLRNRGTETEESINKRISKAKQEMNFSTKFDIVIINDDLETAVKEAELKVKKFIV